MKKYENFCSSLSNMKEIYNYEEPFDNVVLTGLVGLYEICFEQSWKMMKELLEAHGYEEGATGSPRIIVKTAYKAGKMKAYGFGHCRRETMSLIPIIRILHWELSGRQKKIFMICFAG